MKTIIVFVLALQLSAVTRAQAVLPPASPGAHVFEGGAVYRSQTDRHRRHSFGGMLTPLSGDHDSSIRTEVAFAAGANSCHAFQQLRDRTFAAVGKTAAPIMLVNAANDYDTTPGKDISAELDRLHKSHLLKVYPMIGKTSDDGHSLLYLGIPEWESDVFHFLDENVKH